MSDPTLKQQVALFKDKRPTSCFLDQVYDPDVDGPWSNAEDFPRVVPMEGGVVVERETGHLYYVKYVDPVTYKTTLGYTRIVVDIDEEEIKVISYGNDRYTLFVNEDHQPTQLTVSSNFVIFGGSLTHYQLSRTTDKGDREVISMYLDSDENYLGNIIPLLPVATGSSIKQCTNCHTTFTDLNEGDTIIMDVFNNTGILSMSIRLLIQKSVALNDLASDSDMVVGLEATALQQLPDGTFFLYPMQDVSHLGIIPRLMYSDGRWEDIPIDGKSSFCYGLEEFIPTYAGQMQKLILKKFLGPKQYASQDMVVGSSRYVSCEKWLTVLPNESLDTIKISVMPIWDRVTSSYYLKLIAYSDRRDKVYDVTNMATVIEAIDTGLFNQSQKYVVELDLASLFGVSSAVAFAQSIWLKFQHYNDFQRYTISSQSDVSTVYGVESSTIRRPVIHYDKTIEKYFVPTSRFRNKEAMLFAFYECGAPPINVLTEVSYPIPTHFTIRALDNLTTLITTPIPIEQFNNAWTVNRIGDPGMLVGSNVIVEFLKEQGDTYQILYGVPVDIHESVHGYIMEPTL